MGSERLKYTKYSFWSQNGIILAFLGPKRSRFSHHNFFKIQNTIKMTSFWSVRDQNEVVLVLFSLIQNDVVFARTTLNDVVLICIKKKKTKGHRFVSYRDKTTSFGIGLLSKRETLLLAGCDKIKKCRVKKGKKRGKKKKGRSPTCSKALSSGLLLLRFYSVVGTRLCRSLFVSHHFFFSASPSGKLGFIF